MDNLNIRLSENAFRSISLADGCRLARLPDLMRLMGLTNLRARRLLSHLHIPVVSIGKEEWFNLLALDKALYYLSRMGGPGFVGPGSRDSARGSRKNTPRQLSPADMEIINSDQFTFEWLMLKDFSVFNRPRSLRNALTNVRANRKTTNGRTTGKNRKPGSLKPGSPA